MKPLPQRLLSGCVTVLLLVLLAGCGGAASSSSSPPVTTADFPASLATLTDTNVMPVNIVPSAGGNVNIPYVSVTVCIPGTSTCKTIDNVLLDTGSTGLRLFASQISAAPALKLPPQTIAGSSTITECAQFLNTMAWGSVKLADVVLGSKRAASVPVQLLDTSYPKALNSLCGSSPVLALTTSVADNQQTVHANGILGVSLFSHDGQHYFDCASPSILCQASPTASQQVQNPVTLFSTDNNGVVVQLPAVDAAGVGSANGFLIFGVGTQSNNLLGTANVIQVNPSTGYFTTTFKGTALPRSFIDSGSNGLYFNDPDTHSPLSTQCSSTSTGFYCPATTQNLSASITLSASGSSALVNFSIANADRLFQGSNFAFNNLGGTLDSKSFDWGLPFFFGRSIYTVVEGRSVGALKGPFYAFTN
jgi:hypothetical protein